MPQPVEGAFGGQIGRATQNLGNAIGGVGDTLNAYRIKKYNEEQDKIETKSINDYERFKKDTLLNNENEEVDKKNKIKIFL